MGAAILKLDRDWKLLNADVTWTHPVDLIAKRIIPEHNAIMLLKLHYEWHKTISVWARRNLRRERWFKMAQILTLKRNYNLHQSREHLCDIRAFQFSPSHLRIWLPVQPQWWPSIIWIISLYLWYQVYLVIIMVEFLVTVLGITYLRNYFLRV